jgi:hypothetical protein
MEMVFETLVFSLLNHLTQLVAQENFIILSRWESNKPHFIEKEEVMTAVYILGLASYAISVGIMVSKSE